jgi:hypothetical protein
MANNGAKTAAPAAERQAHPRALSLGPDEPVRPGEPSPPPRPEYVPPDQPMEEPFAPPPPPPAPPAPEPVPPPPQAADGPTYLSSYLG